MERDNWNYYARDYAFAQWMNDPGVSAWVAIKNLLAAVDVGQIRPL